MSNSDNFLYLQQVFNSAAYFKLWWQFPEIIYVNRLHTPLNKASSLGELHTILILLITYHTELHTITSAISKQTSHNVSCLNLCHLNLPCSGGTSLAHGMHKRAISLKGRWKAFNLWDYLNLPSFLICRFRHHWPFHRVSFPGTKQNGIPSTNNRRIRQYSLKYLPWIYSSTGRHAHLFAESSKHWHCASSQTFVHHSQTAQRTPIIMKH